MIQHNSFIVLQKMPTMRFRSIRRVKSCINNWMEAFTIHMDESNYMCPEFHSLMTEFVGEMLIYVSPNIVFAYMKPIIEMHSVSDVVGCSYWYLRHKFALMEPSELPSSILKHEWVAKHHMLMVAKRDRLRLLLEKEHVLEIASWKEMQFVQSQARQELRRIAKELE